MWISTSTLTQGTFNAFCTVLGLIYLVQLVDASQVQNKSCLGQGSHPTWFLQERALGLHSIMAVSLAAQIFAIFRGFASGLGVSVRNDFTNSWVRCLCAKGYLLGGSFKQDFSSRSVWCWTERLMTYSYVLVRAQKTQLREIKSALGQNVVCLRALSFVRRKLYLTMVDVNCQRFDHHHPRCEWQC